MKNHYYKLLIKVINYSFIGLFCQLFLAGLCIANDADAQKAKSIEEVAIEAKYYEASLAEIFKDIEFQTDFVFTYDKKDSFLKERYTTDKGRTIVADLFRDISARKDLIFQQINNNISVRKKINVNEKSPEPVINLIDVVGTVTSAGGDPLPGVNVLVKNTNIGTVTDVDGNYSINVPDENDILVFSFIGYSTQEINVREQTEINVTMEPDIQALQEVVVVGYGTEKKVNLTGAVSQISGDVLESRPINNIGQGLQGMIGNLNINVSDGNPNTNPTFNIRGGTSFSNNGFITGSPLILVDNFEVSDINQLNPQDIESISVLKDASSAAIYGARAAHGVILITTKQGKKGAFKVSYSNNFQFSNPVAVPDLLDGYTMKLAQIEAKELTGQTPTTDELNKLQWIKEYRDNPKTAPIYRMLGNDIIWVGNTDVYNEAIKRWSPAQRHSINFSGGSERLNYYASIGSQNQEGLYKINTDIHKRYNVLLNLSTEVTDWFSVNFKTTYNKTDYTAPVNPKGKGGWWTAMGQGGIFNIHMPLKTPEDSPAGEMFTDNILSYMAYGSENNITRGNSLMSIAPSIKITDEISLMGNFQYEASDNRSKEVIPELMEIASTWSPVISPHTQPSSVTKYNEHGDKYALNIYGDFTKTFSEDHHVHGIAGFNQEWMNFNTLSSSGLDMLSPSIPVVSQTLGNKFTEDSESEWAIRGAFFRLNYNFNEKYLFEINGRYDGTSRFPTDSRFQLFPSFSAGWRISEENFAQNFRSIVNNLKLRASYGSLGNQNVANYLYFPSYSTESRVRHLFGGRRPVGVHPSGLVSPDLTWETSTTIDFGVDLSLMNKLDFSYDWYNRTTIDILVAGDRYPALLGTDAPTRNSGEMKTIGWEIAAAWRDELLNNLKYSISLVLSDYQSEITKFEGNPDKILSSLYEGQKMGEIWGYETMGLFQSNNEIQEGPSQNKINSGVWHPGDVRYKDLNDDNMISPGASTIDDSGDRKIIGNSTPRYQFGSNIDVSWKNFDFNLFFQGVGKRDFWTDDKFYWGQMKLDGIGTWNSYENSWTAERPDAFFPGYRYFPGNTVVQSRYLQNAAYFRLKSLTFGYTLPNMITKNIKIDNFRIYFAGQNLWEMTKVIDTLDPELINGTYPKMRSYSIGLQITF